MEKEKYSYLILVAIVFLIILLIMIQSFFNREKRQYEEDKYKYLESMENFTEYDYSKMEKIEIQNSEKQGGQVIKYKNNLIIADQKSNNVYLFDLNKLSGKMIGNIGSPIYKLYFDGENLYGIPYLKNDKGVYSFSANGYTNLISDKEIYQLAFDDEYIYYLKRGNQFANNAFVGRLCRIGKDTENSPIDVIEDIVYGNFKIYRDNIYFNPDNAGLYRADKEGNNQVKLIDGAIEPLEIRDKFILFLDNNDNKKIGIYYLDTNKIQYLGYNYSIFRDLDILKVSATDTLDASELTVYLINEDGTIEKSANSISTDHKILYYNSQNAYYKDNGVVKCKNLITGDKKVLSDISDSSYFMSNMAIDTSKLDSDNILKIIYLNNLETLEIKVTNR